MKPIGNIFQEKFQQISQNMKRKEKSQSFGEQKGLGYFWSCPVGLKIFNVEEEEKYFQVLLGILAYSNKNVVFKLDQAKLWFILNKQQIQCAYIYLKIGIESTLAKTVLEGTF